MQQKVVIIGGGAAGFFAAITMAETNPELEVIILEKGNNVLQKVKISGGGRCNVTHACFIPQELVEFYPRGRKELLGPFHQFMTGDTMEWFENRGVSLKIEDDNRIFPTSNKSESIVNCLVESAKNARVTVQMNEKVVSIEKNEAGFRITTETQEITADKLLIASGSNPKIWNLIANLGHTIVPDVPSLFTFKIEDDRLQNIPGISVPKATVSLIDSKFQNSGPLLITHWGISGPAVLKLSAFGALFLAEKNYVYDVKVNWLSATFEKTLDVLKSQKNEYPKRQVSLKSTFDAIPNRLWEKLVKASTIKAEQRWADISYKQLENLSMQLTSCVFHANGKATFKEEFVTAGGVDLKEINFKRFESKLHKNLFFAGEILNIDAVTGGFNFQNAWTGGFIAGKSIAGDS